MASPTQWTWVWASSGRRWKTGEPGMLQSMGHSVRHDWATEQRHTDYGRLQRPLCPCSSLWDALPHLDCPGGFLLNLCFRTLPVTSPGCLPWLHILQRPLILKLISSFPGSPLPSTNPPATCIRGYQNPIECPFSPNSLNSSDWSLPLHLGLLEAWINICGMNAWLPNFLSDGPVVPSLLAAWRPPGEGDLGWGRKSRLLLVAQAADF